MHSYAPPRRRSLLAGFFLVVLLLVMMVFGGLLLAAVALIGFRSVQSQEARAVALSQLERAQRQVELQRAQLERGEDHRLREAELAPVTPVPLPAVEAPDRPAGPKMIQVAYREIAIVLDGEGNLTMDGKSLQTKQLRTALQQAGKGRERALTVSIRADGQCRFEHVQAVLSVCEQLDIPNVRIVTEE